MKIQWIIISHDPIFLESLGVSGECFYFVKDQQIGNKIVSVIEKGKNSYGNKKRKQDKI